jgi:sugar phosphate isomerase/epimerase
MRLGIFARTFLGANPRSVLRQCADAGFSVVQYNMACSGLSVMPDEISNDLAHAVSLASTHERITLAAVSGTYNMTHPDPSVREKGQMRLKVLASACGALGTNLVTLCTGTRDANDQWRFHPDNNGVSAWRDLLVEMERALDVAEAYGVDLGIEPELANVVNSAAKAHQLIRELGSPRLKVILDPANLFEVETIEAQRAIVSQAIELLADRIVMGHAKDRNAAGDFVAAGTGVLDYPHYLLQLKSIRFDGPLVTHGLSAQEAPAAGVFLKNSLRECGVEIES